jgi:hypothetical protein
MVVRGGLGIGVNVDSSGPKLLCTDPGKCDSCLSVHAGRLRSVGIELVTWDNSNTVVLPAECVLVQRLMILKGAFVGAG